MCVISINIDEAALRDMRPELDTTAAIRLWAQQQIDLCIQQMRLEDEETISVEELRTMLHKTIHEEYTRP